MGMQNEFEKTYYWEDFMEKETMDTVESLVIFEHKNESPTLPSGELCFVPYERWWDKHIEPG